MWVFLPETVWVKADALYSTERGRQVDAPFPTPGKNHDNEAWL